MKDKELMETARALAILRETAQDDFVKAAKDLGIGSRKAYYLVEVARAFDGLPLSDERAAGVGWTKLQVISSRVDVKNMEKLLEMAEGHSAHELQRILEEEAESPEKHCVLFHLSEGEFDLLASVLGKFGAKRKGSSIRGKKVALVLALMKLSGKQEMK